MSVLMFILPRKLQILVLATSCISLSSCVGASIGQQLAQSVIMRATDTAVSNAMDAQERQQAEAQRNIVLKDTVPDEYWGAFITSNFATITPKVEPLPELPKNAPLDNVQTPKLSASRLVSVEVWSLMLGDEKNSVLQKAQLMGATMLPPSNKWQYWQVATGAIQDSAKQPIVFLIPPELGRLRSGERAVVEMAGTGELNVARYAAN